LRERISDINPRAEHFLGRGGKQLSAVVSAADLGFSCEKRLPSSFRL
jgi:transcriptional regulator with AAA-type ATPase domain